MILERRAYTMKPGNLERFYELQVERGFDLVKPIMERVIGYFTTASGPLEQVIHLYAFDTLEDWRSRLHGLYPVPELQGYFQAVRPIMLAQDTRLLMPSPVDALNPLFSDTHTWRPEDAPLADPLRNRDLMVEERIIRLAPGGLPAYWAAMNEGGIEAMGPLETNRIGSFFTMIGPLHQVHHYWFFNGYDDRRRRHNAVSMNPLWTRFQDTVRALVVGQESILMHPAPVPEMVPLFRTA